MLRRGAPQRRPVLAAALVFAAALATSVTLHGGPAVLRAAPLRWACTALLLTLVLLWPVVALTERVLLPRLQRFTPRGQRAWAMGALATAALLVVAGPLAAPPVPRLLRLEVTATGQQSSQSQGAEVWVRGLFDARGAPLALAPEQRTGRWERRDGAWLSLGHPEATLRWEGTSEEEVVLRLVRHPWSGEARVSLDGQTQTVDLFAPTPGEWSMRVPLPGRAAPEAKLMRRVLRVADCLAVGWGLLVLGLVLACREGPERAWRPRRWDWVAASAFCAGVWSLYLVAFWPAFMTPDSMDQWSQALAGTYNNHHPAFHTMLIRLVTRVWESPAAVAGAQVLGLALAFGLAVRELSRWGVPRLAVGVVTLLFALSPVNGAMSITLWKDIAYAIAHLLLFTGLLAVARTRGEALRSTPLVLGLAALLAALALFRHNGVVVALLTVVALVLIVPRAVRRRALALGLAAAGAYLLVTQGLFRVLDVKPAGDPIKHVLQLHQLGAIARARGEALSAEDRQLLGRVHPYALWADRYNCYTVDPVLFSDRLNGAFFASPERPAFLRTWLRLVAENPEVLARHQACVTSMVWRIQQPADGYLYAFTLGMVDNRLGLEPASKWPQLQVWLQRYLYASITPENLWWVWRPALYLYACLLFTVVGVVRRRSGWGLLPVLPVVVHSLVLLGVNIAQDFRYQYVVYVVALVSPSFLFVRRGVDVPLARADGPGATDALPGEAPSEPLPECASG